MEYIEVLYKKKTNKMTPSNNKLILITFVREATLGYQSDNFSYYDLIPSSLKRFIDNTQHYQSSTQTNNGLVDIIEYIVFVISTETGLGSIVSLKIKSN